MPTDVVEQYLKTLYYLQRRFPDLIPMKEVVHHMLVASGTVTSMMKNLEKRNYLEYIPHKGCQLTQEGRRVAIKMVRRHRLIEEFLFRVLHYDWSEVDAEAEILEHAVSDLFIDKIDKLLDYPTKDPHGAPIPTAKGEIPQTNMRAITTFTEHQRVRIARVLDSDSEVLSLFKDHQIVPAQIFSIQEQNETAQIMRLLHEKSGKEITISLSLAGSIYASSVIDGAEK